MHNHSILNKLRIVLLPFSLLYLLVTGLRNLLFNWNVLKARKFEIPVISVGNITIGGTGKTPHTEYLINLLMRRFKVGVLSRGYGRKSTGFMLADETTNSDIIGDEPFQIFNKFNDIVVSVCEDRVFGIQELQRINSEIKVIILDDAYQHRYVKPGLSILLIDSNRPIFSDFLLPAGNLRESWLGKHRADIVIVTKTNGQINAEFSNYWLSRLKLNSNQKLFFTSFVYGEPKPVFTENMNPIYLKDIQLDNFIILVVTGIAQPKSLIDYLNRSKLSCKLLSFPDHHIFTAKDIVYIEQQFADIQYNNKIIITTEKDSVRLKQVCNLPENLRRNLYYLPIKVSFCDEKQELFDSSIIEFINHFHV